MSERVITAAEIEPAVTELNYWLKTLYPSFALRYSSDPKALQNNGLIALTSTDRVAALLTARMMANGAKPTGISTVSQATDQQVIYAMDQLKAAGYVETGQDVSVSRGNLNNVPGGLYLNLIKNGNLVPQPGGGSTTDPRIAKIESRWPGLLDKLAS